jgi:hypothetical protein
LSVNQGGIFDVDGSLWIVVDRFHNHLERYPKVHCAPILDNQLLRLDLDVPIAFQGGFVSLSLLEKISKSALSNPQAEAHPSEVEQIRRKLVTRFSYYSYVDLAPDEEVAPTSPDQPPSIHPGMIFNYRKQTVCVIYHWGCFHDYPLLYVAPIVSELPDPNPLDVEISSQFRDLFSEKYFVRADDFFPVDRVELEAVYSARPRMLGYGLVRKVSRAMALKFGQLGLLL